ncbi:uncharacterized protein DKFZp434B061-like, partial [Penaeus indicus]|uniref:uncharacterized protein DKFZp434B061-like n=1 Tax=Penaeus indicus TaxID=29960 RepID=UPI00300D9916
GITGCSTRWTAATVKTHSHGCPEESQCTEKSPVASGHTALPRSSRTPRASRPRGFRDHGDRLPRASWRLSIPPRPAAVMMAHLPQVFETLNSTPETVPRPSDLATATGRPFAGRLRAWPEHHPAAAIAAPEDARLLLPLPRVLAAPLGANTARPRGPHDVLRRRAPHETTPRAAPEPYTALLTTCALVLRPCPLHVPWVGEVRLLRPSDCGDRLRSARRRTCIHAYPPKPPWSRAKPPRVLNTAFFRGQFPPGLCPPLVPDGLRRGDVLSALVRTFPTAPPPAGPFQGPGAGARIPVPRTVGVPGWVLVVSRPRPPRERAGPLGCLDPTTSPRAVPFPPQHTTTTYRSPPPRQSQLHPISTAPPTQHTTPPHHPRQTTCPHPHRGSASASPSRRL